MPEKESKRRTGEGISREHHSIMVMDVESKGIRGSPIGEMSSSSVLGAHRIVKKRPIVCSCISATSPTSSPSSSLLLIPSSEGSPSSSSGRVLSLTFREQYGNSELPLARKNEVYSLANPSKFPSGRGPPSLSSYPHSAREVGRAAPSRGWMYQHQLQQQINSNHNHNENCAVSSVKVVSTFRDPHQSPSPDPVPAREEHGTPPYGGLRSPCQVSMTSPPSLSSRLYSERNNTKNTPTSARKHISPAHYNNESSRRNNSTTVGSRRSSDSIFSKSQSSGKLSHSARLIHQFNTHDSPRAGRPLFDIIERSLDIPSEGDARAIPPQHTANIISTSALSSRMPGINLGDSFREQHAGNKRRSKNPCSCFAALFPKGSEKCTSPRCTTPCTTCVQGGDSRALGTGFTKLNASRSGPIREIHPHHESTSTTSTLTSNPNKSSSTQNNNLPHTDIGVGSLEQADVKGKVKNTVEKASSSYFRSAPSLTKNKHERNHHSIGGAASSGVADRHQQISLDMSILGSTIRNKKTTFPMSARGVKETGGGGGRVTRKVQTARGLPSSSTIFVSSSSSKVSNKLERSEKRSVRHDVLEGKEKEVQEKLSGRACVSAMKLTQNTLKEEDDSADSNNEKEEMEEAPTVLGREKEWKKGGGRKKKGTRMKKTTTKTTHEEKLHEDCVEEGAEAPKDSHSFVFSRRVDEVEEDDSGKFGNRYADGDIPGGRNRTTYYVLPVASIQERMDYLNELDKKRWDRDHKRMLRETESVRRPETLIRTAYGPIKALTFNGEGGGGPPRAIMPCRLKPSETGGTPLSSIPRAQEGSSCRLPEGRHKEIEKREQEIASTRKYDSTNNNKSSSTASDHPNPALPSSTEGKSDLCTVVPISDTHRKWLSEVMAIDKD